MVSSMFAKLAYLDLKKGLLASFATLLTDAWNFTNAPAMFLIDSDLFIAFLLVQLFVLVFQLRPNNQHLLCDIS